MQCNLLSLQWFCYCLLYTSDAADEEDSVDLGGRRIIKKEITKKDPSVKGFNLGTNIGKVSGQSILHCHLHLIPRREGDVDNPQGGVRSVIPNKQHY